MDESILTRVEPAGDPIGVDAGEPVLRELYRHRPGVVRLGLIRSSDGKAAGADGTSRTLGGAADQRILVTLRAAADVVLVGAQTARRERYGDIVLSKALAAARPGFGTRDPDLAIVTRSGILPPGLTPARTWVITTAGSRAVSLPEPWASRVIVAGVGDVAPRTIVRELGGRGLSRILCEGGPTIAARMLERGVVDEYCLTSSPIPGGANAPSIPEVPSTMRRALVLAAGDFTMERFVSGR